MSPKSVGSHRMRRECPAFSALAAYHADTLGPLSREQVSTHLAGCDFCGAALQLLSRHPPSEDLPAAVPLPLHLRLLAQTLLAPSVAQQKQAA